MQWDMEDGKLALSKFNTDDFGMLGVCRKRKDTEHILVFGIVQVHYECDYRL